jgi:hypothetical protein
MAYHGNVYATGVGGNEMAAVAKINISVHQLAY